MLDIIVLNLIKPMQEILFRYLIEFQADIDDKPPGKSSFHKNWKFVTIFVVIFFMTDMNKI